MKLTAFTVCFRYTDYLAITLPRNMREVEMVVITSECDAETIALCESLGVKTVFSSYLSAKHFRRGKALADTIAEVKPDWALVLDADMMLPEGFGEAIQKEKLERGMLYYSERWEPRGYGYLVRVLNALDRGMKPLEIRERIGKVINTDFYPYGYFQLFSPEEGREYPSRSLDASDDDSLFADQVYGRDRWRALPQPQYTLLHLHHGRLRMNWQGRRSPPISWLRSQTITDLDDGSVGDYECVRPCQWQKRLWKVGEKLRSNSTRVPHHFKRMIYEI